MDDPLLLEWLRVTEEAVDPVPGESGSRLEAAHLRRAELQQRLERHPAPVLSADLARRLQAAEERLSARASTLKAELAARLDSVRKQQQATVGYRPASARRPGFVCHEV